jgi:hypothetical protein
MKTDFKFRIQSLLYETIGGRPNGAMSPVLFAQEMAIQMEFKLNRLARLWLDDEEINQCYEGDTPGLTGHDTLIIGTQYTNDLWLSIWVDSGTGGVPVAMGYRSEKEIVITPIYKKTAYAKKLTIENIKEVFEYIYAHPESIAIHKKSN